MKVKIIDAEFEELEKVEEKEPAKKTYFEKMIKEFFISVSVVCVSLILGRLIGFFIYGG